MRLHDRTMTGQSCRWRLADAVGSCSLAGDSERPAPRNFGIPAEDRESTAPGRRSCPTGTLRVVHGRSAAFVEEQHSQPELLVVVRRARTFSPRSPRVELAWERSTRDRARRARTPLPQPREGASTAVARGY